VTLEPLEGSVSSITLRALPEGGATLSAEKLADEIVSAPLATLNLWVFLK